MQWVLKTAMAIDRGTWKGALRFMWGRNKGPTFSTLVGDNQTGGDAHVARQMMQG